MRLIATLLCLGLFASTGFAQRYELVDSTGRVTATAEALRGRLLVYESTGERIYFSREPRYDSTDRQLLGYFNFELNRVLRFPRSGSGIMQMADLDDPIPRFRNTRRTVRPAIARGAGPIAGGPIAGGPIAGGPIAGGPIAGGPIAGDYYNDRIYGPSTYGSLPLGMPYISGYRSPFYRPQSVLIDSQTVPNPPLPPATLQLTNSGPRELRVTIVDLKVAGRTQELRIAPRQFVEVKVERDAGARLIQNFRTITRYGDVITKEVVTPIPPAIRYEIVAHEWAMQSIAIDRTGKSPSVIEDVNFQGRGLGRFPLPAGDELRSGQIDVYAAARQAGNPGAVAPIIPRNDQPAGNASALERAILEAQQRASEPR